MKRIKRMTAALMAALLLFSIAFPSAAFAAVHPIQPLNEKVRLQCVVWGDPQVSHYLKEREPYVISCANDVKNNSVSAPDALILAGDITENCIQDEWNWIYDDIKDMGVKNYINATGNHDVRLHDYQTAIDMFTGFSNRLNRRAGSKLRVKKAYYSYVMNGYTFIILGSEAATLEEAEISQKQLRWLDRQLKAAYRKHHPTFVILHQPLKDTHGLPDTWGSSLKTAGSVGPQSDQIKAILNKYENTVLITGHLHTGLGRYNFEKIGNFYSLNVPSIAIDNQDGTCNDNGLGYMLEVYDNYLVFRARNFNTGKYLPKYDVKINFYIKSIKLSQRKYRYDGKVKTPKIKVTDAYGKTVSKKYYTVTYQKGRKKPGKYKVTVKFKGKYKRAGKLVRYFRIKR